ncbi:hypothetical protein LVD15_04360 [Fulvivirga maritima]|uniref:hypothetical protein n=1 Tax=Fulvivirga maritima TaxID=2904247 RepID=UPI001F1E1E44|nr:hypothetical protein [Fulvivirga maritima]UII27665.1 hypothetical protein LVD15_04360 [Fulvivirga maritima]
MKIFKILFLLVIMVSFGLLSSCNDPFDEISKKELPTEPGGDKSEPIGNRE